MFKYMYIYLYSNHYLYFIFAHCMFYITYKYIHRLCYRIRNVDIYIYTYIIYICILYTSYIYHIYVYTVHPTCLCMNISTAYIRGKMFPSRQTSRHWHWGRTQKNPIGSREVIYIYIHIYIYPCKVPLKLHTICTVFI